MKYLDPEMIDPWNRYKREAGGKLSAYFRDEWGDILVVSHKRQRVLTFDSLHEQSSMDIKRRHILLHDYTQAMMLGLVFTEPTHISLLGLGGGCLLRALHHGFPDLPVHVVELRSKVVQAADIFFGLPRAPHIEITVNDAQQWLIQAPSKMYSHLISDLFLNEGFMDFQLHRRFISQASRVLVEGGCLILNLHHLPDPSSNFVCLVRAYFPSLFWVQVESGNTILFACGKCRTELEDISWDEAVFNLGERLELLLDRMLSRLEC